MAAFRLAHRDLGRSPVMTGNADRGTDQRTGRPAEDLLGRRIGEQHHAVLVDDEDAVRIPFDEEPHFRLVEAAAGILRLLIAISNAARIRPSG